jgi:hypothetical protein
MANNNVWRTTWCRLCLHPTAHRLQPLKVDRRCPTSTGRHSDAEQIYRGEGFGRQYRAGFGNKYAVSILKRPVGTFFSIEDVANWR